MEMNLLYETYKEKNYNKFLELFNKYIEKGYGVDIPIINTYIIVLIKLRKYDEAYHILRKVEKELIADRLINSVLNSYIRCFKVEDAERILRDYGTGDINPLSLVQLYLLEGKIEEAKLETKIIRKNYILDENQKERLNKFEKTIYNYEYKNGLIETEYESFIKNGNELEVGHIIFLKKKPNIDYRTSPDAKALNRSYMIWKIDGERLSLFPVTGICKEGYRLYHQRYPNSMGDRVIKNNSCTTYKDNVLSVKDKVLEKDLKLVLRSIYDSLYYGQKEYQSISEEFIKSYLKKVECYDVIETVDKESKKHRFFLALEVSKEEIKTIEVDLMNKKIIGVRPEIILRDTILYNVTEIDKTSINIFKEQLQEIHDNRSEKMSLIGKKTTVNDEKLIIIDESDEYYFCINRIYTSSFIIPVIVEKEKVKTIEENIPKEELEYIKLILEQSDINIHSRLRLEKRKK